VIEGRLQRLFGKRNYHCYQQQSAASKQVGRGVAILFGQQSLARQRSIKTGGIHGRRNRKSKIGCRWTEQSARRI